MMIRLGSFSLASVLTEENDNEPQRAYGEGGKLANLLTIFSISGAMLASSARRVAARTLLSRRPIPSAGRCVSSIVARPSISDLNHDRTSSRRRPTSVSLTPGTTTQSSMRWFASGDDLPYHIVVGMPALSPTMESGTISKWNVAEGDAFAAGDSLAVIETDKASMDFEAQDDGVVAKLLAKEGGGEVTCGSPIMVTVEDAADVGAFANFSVGAVPPAIPSPKRDVATPAPAAAVGASGGRVPKIQFLGKKGWAAKLNAPIPPPGVHATASTSAASASSSTPLPTIVPRGTYPPESVTTVDPSMYTDAPASNMRKIIGKRLTESKSTVPHFYTSIEIPLDNILSMRKVLAKDFDAKVSVNDFIIKASAMALRDVPEVNATYDEKTKVQRTFDGVDVSVAVATPTGLITPIIPSTSTMTLAEIGSKMKDLAGRAREGKLQPAEYQGGTFCISNLGMFGISEFSAVINPPQGAILAVGGGVRTIVPGKVDLISGEKGKPVIATVMTARLSADRRVVDEATAAMFMGVLKEYLAQPNLMVL